MVTCDGRREPKTSANRLPSPEGTGFGVCCRREPKDGHIAYDDTVLVIDIATDATARIAKFRDVV